MLVQKSTREKEREGKMRERIGIDMLAKPSMGRAERMWSSSLLF